MKKLMMILFALMTLSAAAQNATNGYYGGGNNPNPTPKTTPTSKPSTNAHMDGSHQGDGGYYDGYGNGGYNNGYGGYNNGYGNGGYNTYVPTPTYGGGCGNNAYYGGGNCGNQGTRVRWEVSPCGTFSWRIEEYATWVPGTWTYFNGCRQWVDGYTTWTPICRTRVYTNHVCDNFCGHGYGTYYWQNGGWGNQACAYGSNGSHFGYYGGYGRGHGHYYR